ncbi:MAG: hypothetical protein C4530_13230 [Desulfobacteraceae bacterium]|nr:MAG: hypothetical protein C4530_13230 [Desulfobacteraceae bacterium]
MVAPVVDIDCFVLLPRMISEYYELAKTLSGAIIGSEWKRQTEFKEAKVSICKAMDRNNPLIGACLWWQESQGQFLSEVQRIRHLWQLLKELDRIYSARPIIRGGGLVLGKRWWNVAKRCDEGRPRAGFLDGSTLTRSYEFPHLRVVDLDDDEWVELGKTKSAFMGVLSKRTLRVGLCPLSGRAKTFFRGTRVLPHEINTVGFLAQEIRFWDDQTALSPNSLKSAYKDELRAAVRWAREERIHILCFPELCVCEEGRQLLRKEIDSDPGELALVLPGSYHVNTDPENNFEANTAPVWLVVDGIVRPLHDYQKVDLMAVEVKHLKFGDEGHPNHSVVALAREAGCEWVKEDALEGNSALLLDTPIGVLAIAVCKDLLWSDRTRLGKYADVADHILVLSMNSSPGWFWFPAQKLSRLGTGVFYVNTPQMVKTDDSDTEIAFWNLPKLGNVGEKTKVCYSRRAPDRQKIGGDYREMANPLGRIICALDFRDRRFLELMTET